eukprot:1897760-Pyramimonas_sp.AAC.1
MAHVDQLDRQEGWHRARKFKAWARDAMVTGPAQVYSITRVQPWAHAQIQQGKITTSHPQAIVDSQMDSWRKIWEGER